MKAIPTSAFRPSLYDPAIHDPDSRHPFEVPLSGPFGRKACALCVIIDAHMLKASMVDSGKFVRQSHLLKLTPSEREEELRKMRSRHLEDALKETQAARGLRGAACKTHSFEHAVALELLLGLTWGYIVNPLALHAFGGDVRRSRRAAVATRALAGARRPAQAACARRSGGVRVRGARRALRGQCALAVKTDGPLLMKEVHLRSVALSVCVSKSTRGASSLCDRGTDCSVPCRPNLVLQSSPRALSPFLL